MGKIAILKTEIDTDPLARGYVGMTNLQIADDMNLVNRDTEGGTVGMLTYLLKNRSRTNTGTDTVATSIYGRLQSVAESVVGDNPFGASGNSISMEHIHTAKMLIALITSPQVSTMDFVNVEVVIMLDLMGGGAGNAKVMKPADIVAIKALSENQQSRGQELGVGIIREGDVEGAKA